MKKFMKYLSISLLVFAVFGVAYSYVEKVDQKAFIKKDMDTLIVYKDPITRQKIFP